MTPIVSIVVTNWNGRAWLERCLRSLSEQTLKPIEIILVDNASTDDSVEFVEKTFPAVRIVRLPENRGHAGPVNDGFRAASRQSRFLAKFDNDARAEPDWLEKLVQALGDDETIGSAACKTLDYHDSARIYSLGDGFMPSGDAFNIARGMRDRPDLPAPRWVFGPSGCTAIYRRSALDCVGLLDDDFWAYHEDIDLDFRLQLAGYKCLYVPQAVAYHVGSATGRKFGERAAFVSGRNRWFVLYKNLPLSLWLRFAWPLARRQAQLAWWALKGDAESQVRCRGAANSVLFLGRELRKRREIQRSRRIGARDVAAMCWEYERLRDQLKAIADGEQNAVKQNNDGQSKHE
jgi:GT2 family glycosyltransferase